LSDERKERGARELSERLGLDAKHIADRLAFYQIGPNDEAYLARLSEICDPRLDEIIADFYAHLLRFPALEEMLRAEPGRVPKLQELQKEYFRGMTRGLIGPSYVESRLTVGDAHQRIGLRPEWYIGGFGLLLRFYLRAIYEARDDGTPLLPEAEALIKAVFFDMSLVLDTYIAGGFVGREQAAAMQHATEIAEEALRAKEDIERLKDDLTSMVVHDLKNPVNGIAMTVQLALRKSADLTEAHVGYLRQIHRTCNEMMRLIQNLLEIAKIEEGKMPVEREAIAVLELLAEVVHEYQPVADQTARRLTVDVAQDLPHVVADRALLRRVLANLVINALRHSGSPEVLLAASIGREGAEILLRVVDRGGGLEPEDVPHVFEKFRSVRRSPTSAPLSDTGLGLPFCRLAVELMGGRIGVESRPRVETTFWLALPSGER
jgi:signal transduction histidine kinase